MKNLFLFIVFASCCFHLEAQELFRLRLDTYQYVENNDGTSGQLKLPNETATVVMGGLNDLDGMNNYFNIFGSKLIVDSLVIGADGVQNVVLRREDGRDIFNLFPTISARLIPIIHPENKIKGYELFE
ncbi:MAG: hypothetical protein WBM77_07325 [Maribacter sp.]